MQITTIDLSRIDPDPNQPRQEVDEQEVKRLALNIRDFGQLQALIVYLDADGKRYRLVDGHRRFAALTMLKRQQALAIVLAGQPDVDTLLCTQLAANCLRVDLSPIDQAKSYQQLMTRRNWSSTQLAHTLHIPKARISQCLAYLTLPSQAQADIAAGTLAGSTAYAIARAPDTATRDNMLEAARKGELSRDDAQAAVRTRNNVGQPAMRVVLRLPAASITVSSATRLEVKDLLPLWQQLAKQCRQAAAKDHDIRTLERQLADECRGAPDSESSR